MTTNNLFPSLSEDGWLNNSIKIADMIFSHFFISDYSQTYLYSNAISSLPWIIQENQGKMSETTAAVRSTLSYYFSRYFNNVVVEVTEIIGNTDLSKGQISIYVSFEDSEAKKYSLGRLIEFSDLIINKIINLSNG